MTAMSMYDPNIGWLDEDPPTPEELEAWDENDDLDRRLAVGAYDDIDES